MFEVRLVGESGRALPRVQAVLADPLIRHLRRDRIAAAAMELFAVRGFDAVSVAEVASAAGVTEKTVFNHFSTKEDLVYSSDRVFEERLIGAVRERAAGSSVHHAVATFLLDLYAGFPNDPTRLVCHQRLSRLVSASPALQSRERLILARYAKALQEVIATEQGAAAEDLRPRLCRGDAHGCARRRHRCLPKLRSRLAQARGVCPQGGASSRTSLSDANQRVRRLRHQVPIVIGSESACRDWGLRLWQGLLPASSERRRRGTTASAPEQLSGHERRDLAMTTGRGVIHRASAGETMRILLGEAASDGAIGVVEMAMAPGDAGPPLHVHPTHAEAFFVLAGTLTMQAGDEVISGGPGTFVCAPRNTPHTLANFTEEVGRVLCIFAPGGFERRFERMITKDPNGTLAELSEAERATRLIGPPLASPNKPAIPSDD
jgi:AcrR family transcriptional regulator/quercetin dioxygenase-like cupin family protein